MTGNAPAISGVIATAPRRIRQRISKSRARSLVAFGLVLLTLASGCATRSKMPATGLDWDQREIELTQLTVWQAHGRIAVKSDDGGGQGQLHWYQTDAGAQIQLSGPFGVGAYELAWGRDSLVVRTKAGEVTAAYAGPEAAEQFLMDQIGWSFPATSLRYWILGVVDPQFAGDRRYDRDGWLIGIEQNDWSIVYDSFSRHNDQWLPNKIVMENTNARVKLIVDKWGL